MNQNPRRVVRNFDDDTCCEAYCPCCYCPKCNCKCNCDCSCNCTKKKMITPTFILSGVSLIFIIIELMTKVSDTETYLDFKKNEELNLLPSGEDDKKYLNRIDDILDIESLEDKFTLALIIVSLFIFFIYLILLICFIYEKQCFANYNPRCKRPYYLLMIILNFLAVFTNAMICFIFFSYRVNSVDEFRDYPYFDSKFGETNDLNISLNIISAFSYLSCLIFHLITCYYLFKEDGICGGCCSEFLRCVNCCSSCIKCFCCCCCCPCDDGDAPRTQAPIPQPFQTALRSRSVVYHSPIPVMQFVPVQNRNINMVSSSYQMNQETSQLRNLMNNNIRNKIESVCQNAVYNSSTHSKFTFCPLCNNDFKEGIEITILPCGHIFHKNCVYTWLVNHKNCPEDGTEVYNSN